MFELFNDEAKNAVALAQDEAAGLGHDHVGTEHLVLGLLGAEGTASRVLTAAGALIDAARPKVAEAVGPSTGGSAVEGEMPLTPRAKRSLERASRFALQRGSDRVGTEHVLLGVLDVEGRGAQVLRRLGIDVAVLRGQVDHRGTRSFKGDAKPAAGEAEGAEPRCIGCSEPLAKTLASRVLTAADGSPDFTIAYCNACGVPISATPRK